LGGDSTAFAVHVETAATHITMNGGRNGGALRAPRVSDTGVEWFLSSCSGCFSFPWRAGGRTEGVTLEDRVRVDSQNAAERHRPARVRIFKVMSLAVSATRRRAVASAIDAHGAKLRCGDAAHDLG
jgi:hypothetical protein